MGKYEQADKHVVVTLTLRGAFASFCGDFSYFFGLF